MGMHQQVDGKGTNAGNRDESLRHPSMLACRNLEAASQRRDINADTRGEDEHGALPDNSNSITGRLTLLSKNWLKL